MDGYRQLESARFQSLGRVTDRAIQEQSGCSLLVGDCSAKDSQNPSRNSLARRHRRLNPESRGWPYCRDARPGEIGNVGIAGHRDGFFRGLKDVAIGDTLELVTEKRINTYVIDRIVIVEPSDVSVLGARPNPSVTLVTCYPFYYVGSAPHRYIVQASLTRSAAMVRARDNEDQEKDLRSALKQYPYQILSAARSGQI